MSLHTPELAVQLSLLMTLGPATVDMGVIGKALFGDAQSVETLKWVFPLLQRESSRYLIEAMWPDFRRPRSVIPTLVIAGDNDAFVPEHEFRYEANFWNGELKILPGVAHGMMLCPRWPDVAKEMIDWLKVKFPPQT
jgi:pimeloyl-ACP methyl ester carboxylesterase